MSIGPISGPIHPIPTRRRGLRYLFYDKHHGQGGRDAACWRSDLSHEAEFEVFNTADEHDCSDSQGNLYGVGRDASGDVLDLGTWGQQVAEFPFTRTNELWHGYPLWPLRRADSPENRRGQNFRPEKAVFQRMESVGLLSPTQRRRLEKGDFA